jgi:hypothetical protein
MAYSVINGQIKPGILYVVAGSQSVTYNSITYATGQQFRGISGLMNFAYSGTGTQLVNEVQEFTGGGIEFGETAVGNPSFPETTLLLGMAVEFELTDAEKIVTETTKITGFAIELIDYPIYSFEIIEARL